MRNTYKYTKMYSGGEPQFVEGDVFRITIPLSEVATATVGPNSSSNGGEINGEISGEINGEIILSDTDKKILTAVKNNPHIKRLEIITQLKIGKSTLYRSLKKLKAAQILKREGSNKTGYWKVMR